MWYENYARIPLCWSQIVTLQQATWANAALMRSQCLIGSKIVRVTLSHRVNQRPLGNSSQMSVGLSQTGAKNGALFEITEVTAQKCTCQQFTRVLEPTHDLTDTGWTIRLHCSPSISLRVWVNISEMEYTKCSTFSEKLHLSGLNSTGHAFLPGFFITEWKYSSLWA